MTDDLVMAIARLRQAEIQLRHLPLDEFPDSRQELADWIAAGCDACEQQAQEIARLDECLRENLQRTELTALDQPLPNGEYPHRLICSGNRSLPLGTLESRCVCNQGKKRALALAATRKAALAQHGRHSVHCRLSLEAHAGPLERCDCGLAAALAEES